MYLKSNQSRNKVARKVVPLFIRDQIIYPPGDWGVFGKGGGCSKTLSVIFDLELNFRVGFKSIRVVIF